MIEWTEKNRVKSDKEIYVGIAGKYTGLGDAYISILKALEHCSAILNTKIKVKWIETTNLDKKEITNEFEGIKGIIIPGGFGSRGAEGKIKCIKYARENKIPFLGLCYGFQMAVIEYSRNVLGLKDANTTEIDPKTKNPVVCILPEQEEVEGLGGTMRLGGYEVIIERNTLAHFLYKKDKVRERFRHRYNVNTKYID
ncbi:MAG: CTP synthetase, partial [Nitrososphaeria archaeon]|nr:CTP synthetase [Nitrososphaeria archaeon]